jgi:hypothetical protein
VSKKNAGYTIQQHNTLSINCCPLHKGLADLFEVLGLDNIPALLIQRRILIQEQLLPDGIITLHLPIEPSRDSRTPRTTIRSRQGTAMSNRHATKCSRSFKRNEVRNTLEIRQHILFVLIFSFLVLTGGYAMSILPPRK